MRILAKYINGTFSVFLEYRHPEVSGAFTSIVSETFSRMLHGLLKESVYTVQELSQINKIKSKLTENKKKEKSISNQIENINNKKRPLWARKMIEENQVELNPQKEAVCAWDGSLTYAELNEQASILGRQLLKLGVHAETRVALCFDKSVSVHDMHP